MNTHHILTFLRVSAAFLAVDTLACPSRQARQPKAAARAGARFASQPASRRGLR